MYCGGKTGLGVVMDSSASAAFQREDEIIPNNNLQNEATETSEKQSIQVPDDLIESKLEYKSQDEERYSKRRRLTETLTPQRSASRPVSPPWRRSGAEGPTTFLVDGKRKSARTNTLPLELQPLGGKRATRATANHSPNVKSKYSSTRQTQASAPNSTSKIATPNVRHSHRLSISTQSSKQSPYKKSATINAKSPQQAPQTRQRVTTHLSSPLKRRRSDGISHKRQSSDVKKVEKEVKRVKRESHHEASDSVASSGDEEEEESEESEIEAVTYTPDPNQRPQRLKLNFKIVSPKAQHPMHISSERKHKSFRDWIEAEGPYYDGEPDNRMTHADIIQEADIRRKVELASRPNGLLNRAIPRIEEAEGKSQQEPSRQYTRHDFMIAHALRFRLLVDREQKKHIGNAKKYAYDAQVKWKASQPKSQEELKADQLNHYAALVLATMRQCVQDLSLKWNLFRQEVYHWKLEQWKEQEEALGKENLKRVIQESEALLDSRVLENSDDAEDRASDGGNSNTGRSEEEDDSDIEDNMSSDGSGGDGEEEGGEGRVRNSDDDLTAEELRKKYNKPGGDHKDASAQQDSQGFARTEETHEQSESEQFEVDEDGDNLTKGLDFEDEEIKLRISQAQQDDSQADLSEDESVDMDPESDMDEDDDDESGQEGSVESDESPGLSALLGGATKPIREKKTVNTEAEESISLSKQPSVVRDVTSDTEIHHIPDAAQVQTPVSNNEAPTILRKEHDQSPDEKGSSLRFESTADEDMDMDRPGTDDTLLENQGSMPATPISVDLERKHIPALEIPHLLRATLREYQKEGFYWLADRYEHGANGILADEMGLGKTIQTITLLAYLALKHEVWGPHLIVVPTSVILNWEMEFKKFLPSFKVLSYYGSQEERKTKRRGWLENDRWNVVITSYQLVVADQISFKRRPWHYLVLDEAHNIKNFRSLRWQTLLTFKSHSKLLLTGTPLQNNLEELWSLLFFLIGKDKAEDFLGRQEFAKLFRKPADQILEDDQQHLDAEAREQVRKLHQILRPRLLRRLKADVEKQMPGKYEHVVYCRLSKRQRYLYDGFLSRSETRGILAHGNYLSIINCLMQLRKVCNHPDLFETRPIVTSFAMHTSVAARFEIQDSMIRKMCLQDDSSVVNLDVVDLLPGANGPISALDTIQRARLNALFRFRELVYYQSKHGQISKDMRLNGSTAASTLQGMENQSRSAVLSNLQHRVYLTSLRSQRRPLYSHSLAQRLILPIKTFPIPTKPKHRTGILDWHTSRMTAFEDMVKSIDQRSEQMQDYLIKFTCTTPAVVAPDLFELTFGKSAVHQLRAIKTSHTQNLFKESSIRQAIAFPDKRLLQFDCGKLQKLDALLRKLQTGGHRALIFTQMTKVLDILEQFLNIHGHRYLRLDGSTKLENRQLLTERFNTDPSILVFILSSRSGGIGINLTGADTVIFYDLDWNPAMDKQCQDRAHRIGQTRDVHIYRFVSEHTIEANILRKSNQKRLLDDVIIQEGDFTTDYFNKPSNPRDLFDEANLQDPDIEASAAFDRVLGIGNTNDATTAKMLGQAEDREDVAAARIAEKEVEQADEDGFDDDNIISSKPARSNLGQQQTQDDPSGSLQSAAISDHPSQSTAWLTGEVHPRTDMAVDIFKDKPQPTGVDRYIVEFLEWEAKDIPFIPPDILNKKKRRNDDHRVKRRNR